PERVLEVRVALAGDAMNHLPVRALELLPRLLIGEDLVDTLEGLEVARVEIERVVEELDRAVLILEFVAADLRLREHVARLDLRPLLELGDRLQRVDHALPLRSRLVEPEELVEQDV